MPRSVLAEARAQNRLPIFVGGTGLYFKALTRGLSAVPPIPPKYATACARGSNATASRRCMRNSRGAIRRFRRTAEAARPHPHRARAGSGRGDRRSLTDWHRDGLPPLLPPGEFTALFLAPEREELYARIDARFDAMLAAGALEEVERLGRTRSRSAAAGDEGAWRAGADPASAGEITLEEAAEIGRADTRHYAKRQFTWFRHQLPEFEWVRPEAARGWLDRGDM